jgi:predicted O-linked N-acetylglucosamine transferase (SPINDLY family)
MLRNVLKQLLRRAPAGAEAEALARAVALQAQGRLAEAEASLRALLERAPRHGQALHLLGHVLTLQGRAEEAAQALRRLTACLPRSAEAWFSLGAALRALDRPSEAAQAFDTAAGLDAGLAAAPAAAADALASLGRLDEAEERYLRAIAAAPRFAEAHYNYGNLLHRSGRIEEAVAAYRRALEIRPDFVRAHSNLVYALNFSPAYDPDTVFREHLEWARRHASALAPARSAYAGAPEPRRRLRVGYVSPNFREHAVACFFEPLLRHHDRERFSIHLYSDVARPDARTARLRAFGDTWREIAGLGDEAVADLVARDAVDILVDLTGHTEGHRLLVFARRPAPVQVTWMGYANTTGLAAMDYRVVDAITDPPGFTERWHSERLVRLARTYLAFEPPRESPAVAPPPRRARGYVTFGSFNAFAKIAPPVIETWARVLSAVPGSRLLMVTVPEGSARERVLRAFAAHGIAPERLDLRGTLAFADFLAAHAQADIALDPFPFAGTTTTCHTLWMGVPVVTLAGRTHAARVGASLLSAVGLAEWVARDPEEYVALAARLASDGPALDALRAELRDRVLGSPLADGAGFARDFEDALRKMWEDYCARARLR